jgi:hypothetical protein
MIIQRAKLHFVHSIEYNYAPSSFELTWTKNNATQQITISEIWTNMYYHTLELNFLRKYRYIPYPKIGTILVT